MAAAVSRAIELGARALVAPSAGNAGGALAAYGAAGGVPVTVVMPADVPAVNRDEALAMGARVLLLDELEQLGLVGPERPRMVAVQAEGCAPIVRAFERGERAAERWEGARTRAAGLRVPAAVGDTLILAALRSSGGTAVAVSEGA